MQTVNVHPPVQVTGRHVSVTEAMKDYAIGKIEHLSEDERGLRVIARLADARASRLLESGKVEGLSFGYRVREAKTAGRHRELIALDLVEVSLVANPMQPRARVHAVE